MLRRQFWIYFCFIIINQYVFYKAIYFILFLRDVILQVTMRFVRISGAEYVISNVRVVPIMTTKMINLC